MALSISIYDVRHSFPNHQLVAFIYTQYLFALTQKENTMSNSKIFEKNEQRTQLIYTHTHRDFKGECKKSMNLTYMDESGKTVLGHPSGMPDITYAEHYIYALLKEFSVLQERVLQKVIGAYSCAEKLKQTCQWRGSIDELEILLQDEEAAFLVRDKKVLFLDDLKTIYSQVCSINKLCCEGVLTVGRYGFNCGESQLGILNLTCEKLEEKVTHQRQLWCQLHSE